MLFLLAAAGFWILVKEGKATDYRRCRLTLKSAFHQWESRGRPGIEETQAMLQGIFGMRPYILTNEITVGITNYKAAFALPASYFGERGTLVVTTNGIVVRILENGRAVIP